jgi:hypothetical protein
MDALLPPITGDMALRYQRVAAIIAVCLCIVCLGIYITIQIWGVRQPRKRKKRKGSTTRKGAPRYRIIDAAEDGENSVGRAWLGATDDKYKED